MADKLYLLVGLGNPGERYSMTRHNVGFIFLDYLAERLSLVFKRSKWQALQARAMLLNTPVLLVKPETYMNLSGEAVGAIARYYQVPAERVIVVHDDLDLPQGRVKIVGGRGAGGHKGIISIIKHLGGTGFPRIKIGIGRPSGKMPADRYVLAGLDSDDLDSLMAGMGHVEEGVRLIIEQGISEAMNQINSMRA
ncbi:MAG: aminoacyl-tRNA hydrolase [Desulfobulbaceae bacterium]|nr:aminoacyl-tRNA hydrolase [Desulfobulbaceae bacterium]MCK5322611.1 aminoacyl-tRNA hydrolase [Desulfobulbaceae bacterium]MCK5437118.1 aminoacyl-tRNA hydrolase [Desulfobulbaceae bacterium]MCK5545315.1 aminoacyl-tRNA hydrolase [Desulfobulbaceae bacterium]